MISWLRRMFSERRPPRGAYHESSRHGEVSHVRCGWCPWAVSGPSSNFDWDEAYVYLADHRRTELGA